MLSHRWNQVTGWVLGNRARLGVVRYVGAVLVVLGLCFLLPVDTVRDSRVVVPVLLVVACAWYGGVGPGIVALLVASVTFKYRANGFPACFDYSRRELSTLGVIAVVAGLVGWAGTLRRRSQALARRQAIELRELHRRKDEFLATLAHELRNPMAPLRSGLEILRLARRRSMPSLDIDEVYVMMQRQVDQLVRLVDDLLEVSRINTGRIHLHRERVLLADVIRDAVETSRPHIAAAEHELSVILPDHPLFIDADRARMTQVFANLLNNAAKFTPPSGKIRLSVARKDDGIRIAVDDTGIGVAHDMLLKIFDMFSQIASPQKQAHGGLGIGLCLARAIVELHGGSIQALSEGQGKGTSFVVTLPEGASALRPTGAAAGLPTSPPASGQGRRILIVDDNADGASSLAMLLAAGGHQCRAVNDGPSALELAPGFHPELFLIDIGMPTMSGHELAARLRAMPQFQNSVLVAVTGWGKEEDRRKSRDAGFDAHLVKPVTASALADLLEQFFDAGINPKSDAQGTGVAALSSHGPARV